MRFLPLLIVLLLVSCAVEKPPVPEQRDLIVEVQEPDIPELLPELHLSLSATNSEAELTLESTLYCNVTGGVPPYKIVWLGQHVQTCTVNTCSVVLTEIGNYATSCTASDSKKQFASDDMWLTVTKDFRTVHSIINLGDSLTYGYGLENPETENWAALFANNFKDAAHHNFAISGGTSYNVQDPQMINLRKTSEYKNDSQYKLIFLWIGANDIIHLIPPEDFRVQFEKTVKELNDIPNAEVILVTIPDVSKLRVADSAQEGLDWLTKELGLGFTVDLKSISKEVVLAYNQQIFLTANKYNLNVIDMFQHMETLNQTYIQQDEFHPNVAGHKEVNFHITNDLVKFYPDVEFVG